MTLMIFFGKVMRCRKRKEGEICPYHTTLICDREEYKNVNGNTAKSNHNGEDYGSPPTNHKDDTDSGTSSASSTTTFEDSATSTTKEVC